MKNRMLSYAKSALLAIVTIAIALSLTGCTADSAYVDTGTAFIEHFGALLPVVGFAAPLIALIVDAAKRFRMPSKYAPALSLMLNALVYCALYFANDAQDAQIQSAIEAVYAIAPYVITISISLLATPGAHRLFTWAGIGYSVTPRE